MPPLFYVGQNNTLAYSNSFDYPLHDARYPVELPYVIGGMYFNGAPKSATVISPYSNAAVEMYETINKDGKTQSYMAEKDFAFSFTTEGTNRTIIQAAACVKMEIRDNYKLENADL